MTIATLLLSQLKQAKAHLKLSLFFILLFSAVLFTSCSKGDDAIQVAVAKYSGNFIGIAEEDYRDFGNTYTRKDTTYTNVQVNIAKSAENNKLTVVVLLPNDKRRKYSAVDVIDGKLFYHFSARGCGCTQSIAGQMQENTLELSLYNYESGVIDSRINIRASKLD